MFETAECEEGKEFHISGAAEIRKAREPNERWCHGTESRLSDWQVNAWTSWACDTVKLRRGMADDRYVMC